MGDQILKARCDMQSECLFNLVQISMYLKFRNLQAKLKTNIYSFKKNYTLIECLNDTNTQWFQKWSNLSQNELKSSLEVIEKFKILIGDSNDLLIFHIYS